MILHYFLICLFFFYIKVPLYLSIFFFFNDTAPPEISPLPLHDALPISVRIFTGAPLPAGADTVIRQEDTEPLEGGRVAVRDGRDARKNIRHRGEDIRTGAVALATGTALGPAQLGVLASIAHAAPLVHRPPRVAFLGSGDDIVDLDHAAEILAGTKIATSNSYTLFGMIHRAGGVPLDLEIGRAHV